MDARPARVGDAHRRGMLLMIVLSVLALFVIVGAVGLLTAIRAREAARAFAAAGSGQVVSSALARAQLEEALLKLIRGPSNSGTSAWGKDVTECLLEDKYGISQSCRVTGIAGVGSAYMQVTLNGINMTNPAAVAGRVLTFVPARGDSTGPTSHRILRALPGTTTSGTVLLGNVKQLTPLPLPSVFPCEAIINGREFSATDGPRLIPGTWPPVLTNMNEPYDAFDDPGTVDPSTLVPPPPLPQFVAELKQNPFLTVIGADVVVRTGTDPPSLASGTLTLTSGPTGANPPMIAGLVLQTGGTYSIWPFYWASAVPKVLGPAFGPPAPPGPPLDPTAVMPEGTFAPAQYPLPPCTVDNDGDGVADGVWLSDVLPPQRSPEGSLLSFDVSYLVLDLDGRINLNAHGSFVRAQVASSTPPYVRDPRPYVSGTVIDPSTNLPTVTMVTNTACFPVGMGYGPADVDASLLVSSTAEVATGAIPAGWSRLLLGGTMTTFASYSSRWQWRPTPWTSATVPNVQPGRYDNWNTSGSCSMFSSHPGPGTNAVISSLNKTSVSGTNPLLSDYWVINTTPSLGAVPPNSPTDLKARLQVYTGTTTQGPTLTFARPAGSNWSLVGTDTLDVTGTAVTVHPYVMRLDGDAPRGASRNADDAIFTLGELERILRPFDADASGLEPRLAAMLDEGAERSRLTATTDSWDTPAITGAAAQVIAATGAMISGNAAPNNDVNRVHAPDVVSGLRMNLNRPFSTDTAARYEYFRQLYALAMAMGGPAPADAAQWAANVVEFRDSDSIMTWYPYDPTPFDADDVVATGTAPGVWGAERPEMVITSATYNASANTVAVSLFRPWDARLVAPGMAVTGTTEVIDGSLGDRAANTLTLTGSSGTNAIWRLAIVGSSTTTTDLATLLNPTGAATTGTTLAVNSGTTVTGSAASPPTRVVLLRLANPLVTTVSSTSVNDLSKNDYVPVHTGSISTPGTSPRRVTRWLHWPNRDFVSHGELLTVPSGSAAAVGDALFGRNNERFLVGPGGLMAGLLDATIVPSRFRGANVSVDCQTTNYLAGTGYENFRHGQFSTWREAGRVNLNTVVSNTGNGYVVVPSGTMPNTLDYAVWTALTGSSGSFNPVGMAVVRWPLQPSERFWTSNPFRPLKNDREILVSASDTRLLRSGDDVNSAFLERSPAIRLANVATPRSHVFAVWITLRITDSSATAGPPRFARLFAIVDRSIPVGYAPGRTLNVRETIRLLRYLE